MKNTLYVTDLDGTLLTPDQTISDYTKTVINGLVDRGMLFTYATARSGETSSIVTSGLKTSAPRIFYNGAIVCDSDGSVISAHTLGDGAPNILDDLIAADVYPIVYSVIGGRERFSFLPNKLNSGGEQFINTRKSCVRYNPVGRIDKLYAGDIFYILCIDHSDKLAPLYCKYRPDYNCVYHTDIYSGARWLEIMPKAATKANALTELKRNFGCRLVVFGDGKNDIDMFRVADERYAVENAVNELKEIATAVIGSNCADSVAKWLERNVCINR